jgi:hypothetical protein
VVERTWRDDRVEALSGVAPKILRIHLVNRFDAVLYAELNAEPILDFQPSAPR